MKNEFKTQFAHTWRVFAGLVRDFDPDAWLRAGRGAITPARLSLHILQSAKSYLEDPEPMHFASGKNFENPWETAPEAELPSQSDILTCIDDLQTRTSKWLSELDPGGENTAFPWAGKTNFGVALFSLRYSLYHLGELSALLNESKHGGAEDNYAKALR